MKIYNRLISVSIILLIIIGCGSGSYLMESGKIDKNRGEFEKAIENFDAELALNPQNADAWYWKGYCQQRLRRWSEMRESYKHSIEISDNFKGQISKTIEGLWMTYYNESIAALEDSSWDKALANLDTASIIDPENFLPYRQAATVAKNAGYPKRAIDYALSAYKFGIDFNDSLDVSAFLLERYLEEGNLDEIITWSKKVIELAEPKADNEKFRNYYLFGIDNLAESCIKNGMLGEAEAAFANAMNKFPENIILKLNLAASMTNRKDYENAMMVYENILAIEPNNLKANLQIGLMLIAQGDDSEDDENLKLTKYKKAIPYLEKVIELDPENAPAIQSLPAVYFATGDQIKGNEMIKRFRELKNKNK